jgi:hypothetical protein
LGVQQMMMMMIMMRMMKTFRFVEETKLNDDVKDGLSCAWSVKMDVHATIYFLIFRSEISLSYRFH